MKTAETLREEVSNIAKEAASRSVNFWSQLWSTAALASVVVVGLCFLDFVVFICFMFMNSVETHYIQRKIFLQLIFLKH